MVRERTCGSFHSSGRKSVAHHIQARRSGGGGASGRSKDRDQSPYRARLWRGSKNVEVAVVAHESRGGCESGRAAELLRREDAAGGPLGEWPVLRSPLGERCEEGAEGAQAGFPRSGGEALARGSRCSRPVHHWQRAGCYDRLGPAQRGGRRASAVRTRSSAR